MNAQDLLSAFSKIDPAYLHEATQRAAASDCTWAADSSRPQRKEHTMKKHIKRIAAGLSAAAAVCALAIGTGIYYQKQQGYTMQSSIVPVEPVTDTTAPADAPPPADGVLPLAEAGSDLIAGQHVLFGDYEWRVLEVRDDRALLLTEYGIDCRPFDETGDASWETCSLRAWLNGEFYNSFSEEDRAKILTVTNETNQYDYLEDNEKYVDHIVTEDTFFCLGEGQREYYCNLFGDLQCIPTQTAIHKGVYIADTDNGYCTWWLRTPCFNRLTVATDSGFTWLEPDGTTTIDGKDLSQCPAVRPAVWVRTKEPQEMPPTVPLAEAGSDLIAGQHVLFGDYEWRVLDIQDGRALLITEYGIDCRPYNDELADVTWETCSLRAWLNGDFYNSFSEEDRARILTVTNETPDLFIETTGDGPSYTISGGNDTEDTFFCLSTDEAEAYFHVTYDYDAEEILCTPMQTAIDNGVAMQDGHCRWWLRSPGGMGNTRAAVGDFEIDWDGEVDRYIAVNHAGLHVDNKGFEFDGKVYSDHIAVRPAVWVQIAEATASTDDVLPLAEAGSDLIAGQHVLFGDYEWRVLDIQDGRALLITEYGIDCRPYNDELADVTWETCSLRAWLNGDFYNSFSEEDRARILTVTNETPDAFFEGTGADLGTHTVEGGNDTEDTFFCLSVDEANQYFCTDSEEDMLCKPTKEVIDKGVFLDNGYCTWWLRSPGYNSQSAAVGEARIYVPNDSDDNFGSITRLSGKQVHTVSSDEPDTPAVRPAVWVQIEQ